MKTFILGAADPEMSAIESLLQLAGATIFYAADASGQRVTPATAYSAAGVIGNGQFWPLADTQDGIQGAFLVECDFPEAAALCVRFAGRCDHHRPAEKPLYAGFCDCGGYFQGYGVANACLQCSRVWRDADPGYGKSPDQFWQASSIGQVASLLGIPATPELLMVAAADHCLAAAYAGQCPGVDATALAEYRIEQLCSASRASNRGEARTPDEVRASIERAKAAIQVAPIADFGVLVIATEPAFWPRIQVADLRGPQIPDLPEAAMVLGVAYLAGGVSLREGDAPKIVVGGCGEGTIPGVLPVEAFLAAAREGSLFGTPVRNAYGDPVRGFAGAYI